jgi:hypothetical protein
MNVKKLYKGMTIVENNIDIETYLLQNPDKLFLLITSSCLPEKRRGNYKLMLRFKGQSKLLTKDLNDVSNANECALKGIKEAINSLTAPNFEIILLNCIGTGLHRYVKDGKSSNKELIEEIFKLLDEKQCFVSELIFKGKANEIKQVINVAYPLSKNKKNQNKLKELNINDYTKEIILNTKKEMYSQIIQNMVELRFTENSISSILQISEKDVRKFIELNKKKQK